MEEGGQGQDSGIAHARDSLRNVRRKQVESEERLKFLRKLVGREISVREIEHLGDELNNKFRSENMKGGRSEQAVLKSIMDLKYKDKRRFQREIKVRRNEARKLLEQSLDSKNSFTKIISHINNAAKKGRKMERSKFNKKVEHLNKIKLPTEIEKLQECPPDIKEYRNTIVFDKVEFDKIEKEETTISRIGEVELDSDEVALLKLPPKFAIRQSLKDSEMQTEI